MFDSYASGLRAEKNQITLDATRSTDVNGNPINTVSDLVCSWAPPSENNTAAYIAAVSNSTGYDPSAPLSSLGSGSTCSLAAAVDLATLRSTVELSSIGIPSPVPVYAVLAAVLVGIALVRS